MFLESGRMLHERGHCLGGFHHSCFSVASLTLFQIDKLADTNFLTLLLGFFNVYCNKYKIWSGLPLTSGQIPPTSGSSHWLN